MRYMSKGTKEMSSCHVSSYPQRPESAPKLFALTWPSDKVRASLGSLLHMPSA